MRHLKLVHENYFKHMIEAWLIVITFITAGLICFIHSIFPFLFQTTASTMVKNIIARTNKRQGIDD
jgi:hypothetical protein